MLLSLVGLKDLEAVVLGIERLNDFEVIDLVDFPDKLEDLRPVNFDVNVDLNFRELLLLHRL